MKMSNSALDLGLLVTTVAVAIAVALEGICLFQEARADGWKNLKWLKRVEVFGFGLLIFGLGTETYFASVIHSRDTRTISQLAGENSKLEKSLAGQARRIRAADARLDEMSSRADRLGMSLDDLSGEMVSLAATQHRLAIEQSELALRQTASKNAMPTQKRH